MPGGEGPGDRLRGRGEGPGLCGPLPDPAWGGRGAGGLGVPLWGDCHPPPETDPAGPQHPRALMIGKEKSHAGQADHGTTEV